MQYGYDHWRATDATEPSEEPPTPCELCTGAHGVVCGEDCAHTKEREDLIREMRTRADGYRVSIVRAAMLAAAYVAEGDAFTTPRTREALAQIVADAGECAILERTVARLESLRGRR